MLLIDNLYHLINKFWMFLCYVLIFVKVCCKVVKMWYTTDNNELPVSHTHTYLIGLSKLPIKVWVEFLCLFIAHQGWENRDSIEIIDSLFFINIAFWEVAYTCHITESWHQVVECKRQVIGHSFLNMSLPTGNKRNTNSSFVTLAFKSSQLTITIEEGWVGSTLLMRTIVTG